jgi:hypothetical protein
MLNAVNNPFMLIVVAPINDIRKSGSWPWLWVVLGFGWLYGEVRNTDWLLGCDYFTSYPKNFPRTNTLAYFFQRQRRGRKVLTDVDTRYQQILFPALRLCQALLSSLGSANRLDILMSFSMGKLTKIAEG